MIRKFCTGANDFCKKNNKFDKKCKKQMLLGFVYIADRFRLWLEELQIKTFCYKINYWKNYFNWFTFWINNNDPDWFVCKKFWHPIGCCYRAPRARGTSSMRTAVSSVRTVLMAPSRGWTHSNCEGNSTSPGRYHSLLER